MSTTDIPNAAPRTEPTVPQTSTALPNGEPCPTSPTIEFECELRCPIYGMDGECFSDPEDYTDYRSTVLAVEFSPRESKDAIRLGLIEGLQENTHLPSGAEPLLSLDLIKEQPLIDKEQSAKTGVQDPVHSEFSARPTKDKTLQMVKEYTSYRLGHMSGTNLPRGNGGKTDHSLSAASGESLASSTALSDNTFVSGLDGTSTLADISFTCAFAGCERLCSLLDAISDICPKCGPFSTIRYCGKEHLWHDAILHWKNCGQFSLIYQYEAGPIPKEFFGSLPMLHNIRGFDSPERHRQALGFVSATNYGDYFVFADFVPTATPKLHTLTSENPVCSTSVEFIVRFDDPVWKDRFRRVLAICLFEGIEYQGLCGVLFRLIRGWMRSKEIWNPEVEYKVAKQIDREMGFVLPLSKICRHNVQEKEWDGSDLSPLDKTTHRFCLSKGRRFQEKDLVMGQGIGGLCSEKESTFEVLRAHRIYHPTVRDMMARVNGVGF
ncbi:uncharacterized protein N7511_005649 [Penicillium nucicola]|uniref:uncharacterized protein n=1 Tax=Penicillium nucicola TaxID=1850975 RepID=UPI002544E081|nr:uncharacterized protein N7511_005649 [Penicillium nucicola]KAJ5762267.1 hypothetical protein N7511_005649 [Penicillium nucicola]